MPGRRDPGPSPGGRVWPLLILTGVLLAGIALLGSVAGPRWMAEPVYVPLEVDSADVAITAADGAMVGRAPQGTYETARVELRIDVGGVSVPAWMVEPVGAPTGPGVVFIHGAGTVDPDAFAEQVHALASTGIRALVPAKRTDTYSTRHRDYPAMARDYLASWRVLRDAPGVDPARVGLYGESEGAWIAPIAARAEPGVAFVILASAPVVTPREQAAYATATYLHNTNVPRGLFRSIPRALGATIPGGGFDYIDFDVRPYLEGMEQPVLMVYGTADASMPIAQGALITREYLARGGNTALTVRYFPGADHGLKVDGHLAPGVGEVLSDWVWGLPATAHSAAPIAGDTPSQVYLAGEVPAPPWYASGDFLVYSALAVVLLSLVGLVLCAAGSARVRALVPPARYAVASVLAAFTVVTVFLGYVGQVARLAVEYRRNDILALGGWGLVYASGVFAVMILAVSLRVSLRHRWGARPGEPVLRIGVWASHLGALGILLIAAYWGAFPNVG